MVMAIMIIRRFWSSGADDHALSWVIISYRLLLSERHLDCTGDCTGSHRVKTETHTTGSGECVHMCMCLRVYMYARVFIGVSMFEYHIENVWLWRCYRVLSVWWAPLGGFAPLCETVLILSRQKVCVCQWQGHRLLRAPSRLCLDAYASTPHPVDCRDDIVQSVW